ncbi:MAG: hypothetical protein ABI806_19385 [Candidatus Solibacter sp.]
MVDQVVSARQQVDFASSLLLKPSPEALERCSTILEEAGRQLAEWQPELTLWKGDADTLAEAWHLRRSVQRTSRLLRGAAEFHSNWLQIRGAMTGGYTKTGEPAPLLHGHRICLEG